MVRVSDVTTRGVLSGCWSRLALFSHFAFSALGLFPQPMLGFLPLWNRTAAWEEFTPKECPYAILVHLWTTSHCLWSLSPGADGPVGDELGIWHMVAGFVPWSSISGTSGTHLAFLNLMLALKRTTGVVLINEIISLHCRRLGTYQLFIWLIFILVKIVGLFCKQ